VESGILVGVDHFEAREEREREREKWGGTLGMWFFFTSIWNREHLVIHSTYQLTRWIWMMDV
jgi:hypothetical protein